MSDNKLSYPLSFNTWNHKEYNAVVRLLKTGNLTYGKYTKQFEKNFSKHFNYKYSVFVNSGSSANLLAIASLFYSGKIKAGDEVIVPSVSWSTTYSPLIQFNLNIKVVDVDLETLNYSELDLQNNINKKTKLVIAVNLLGNPNNFKLIKKLQNKYKFILFEDNCESLGAKYNNKYTGNFGIMCSNSFFFSHHMSTIEGGMISTNNLKLYKYLVSLRSHGWDREFSKKNNFYSKFNFILPGYNLRPTEINAVVGIIQLKKINQFNKIRKQNAKYFYEKFKNNKIYYIQKEIGESSWFGFSLITKDKKINRDKIINLLKKNKVDVRPIVCGDVTKNSFFKYANSTSSNLKNAKIIHKHGFFVGNNPIDLKKQIDMLHKILI